MAGKGYGKDVRQQMNTYNTANPNATSDQKLGQRKSALTAAQTAMSQPGAAPSSRITNRLNRVNKRMAANPTPAPTAPPTASTGKPVTTNPMPSTKPPTTNIAPGEENAGKLGGALPPTGVGGSTSLKKKKQPRVPPVPTPLM